MVNTNLALLTKWQHPEHAENLLLLCSHLAITVLASEWVIYLKHREASEPFSKWRTLRQTLKQSQELTSKRTAGGARPLKAGWHLSLRSAGQFSAYWPNILNWLHAAQLPPAPFAASFWHSILQLLLLAATQCFSRLLNSCCAQSLR